MDYEVIPDILEQGEIRAELYEDRIRGNTYICSCGNECLLHEAETLSPHPYAEPFCPSCVKSFLNEK